MKESVIHSTKVLQPDHRLIYLFVLFSCLFPIEALYLFSKDIAAVSLVFVSSYLAIFVVVQGGVLLLVARYYRKIFHFIYSALIVLNYLFLYLTSFRFVAVLQPIIVFIAFIGVTIVLWKILSRYSHLIDRNTCYLLSVLSIAVFVLHLPFGINEQNSVRIEDEREDVDAAFKNWKEIVLSDKPNIYLIGFDAMIPVVSANRFMGVERLEYTDVLNSMAYTSERSYAPKVATSASLNSLMNFDQNLNSSPADRFMGSAPSLLASMFQNNGYRVSTGWTYLKNKGDGRFIDHFMAPDISYLGETTLCVEESANWSQYKFFALCRYGKYLPIGFDTVKEQFSALLEVIIRKLNLVDDKGVLTKNASDAWVKQVFESITTLSSMKQPQISIFYIYDPMTHTNSRTYQHSDLKKREQYKNKFLDNSDKLASIFKRLHSAIMEDDPTAIVIVFGDHGAYFTRGISPREKPEMVYFDRHVIELGLLKTQSRCASREALAYSRDYATSARMLVGVIRCLAANPEVLDGVVDFVDMNTPVADLEAFRKTGGH